MATASFKLTVDGRQETDVLQALQAELLSVLIRPGCAGCEIERSVNGRSGLRFHSRWDSERHLRDFLASDVVTGLLQLLELSIYKPEVLICWGDEAAGLRSLKEIRGFEYSSSATEEIEISGCGCESSVTIQASEERRAGNNCSGRNDQPGTRDLGSDSGEEDRR